MTRRNIVVGPKIFGVKNMTSNFDFLMADDDTSLLADSARNAEQLYTQGMYDAEFAMIRKVIENVAKMVVDFDFDQLGEYATFNDHLRHIKAKGLVEQPVMDIFYDLKRYGNEAAHSLDKLDKAEGLKGLSQMLKILLWFTNKYTDQNLGNRVFFEPQQESVYKTAERKLIYVHQVDNSSGKLPLYDGLEKVGEASTPADDLEADWTPNSEFLREIADKRINQYMETAGLPHNTQWAELAYRKSDKTWFHDYDVHEVLQRSGVKKSEVTNGNEWYETDVDTVRKAIAAVKAGQSAIDVPAPAEPKEIVLRPEQNAALAQTKKVFAKKSGRKMLWNAKMRFGKTLTALQLIKDEQFEKVLIMTHRPVVSDSWFDDFRKMKMTAAGYERGSKTTGKKLPELLNLGKPFVYFASIQDLRGSEIVGGKAGDKNRDLFETDWDLVIIDEAHEGTQTELAENVLKTVVKDNTKTLELSGTPFNLLDQYEDDNVYTWDYVMEQQAKQRWENEHPGEPNPYESLPKVSMYTFEMKNKAEFSDESKSFNFKEFFRVDDEGNFVHESDVKGFLDEITRPDGISSYPYSTQEYREELRHTLWLLPGVKEARALANLMKGHEVFGREYKIVNVVDDGKEDYASESDLQKVREAITDQPSETKTITLTVRKLTTGVNVREWTAVMFLSNTNSAMQYLQAAFRAQTPFSDEKLGMKTNAYIFDFAPDRALTVMAESTNLGSRPGKRISGEQKDDMRRLLNFMPIIGESGNVMKPFNVDSLLTKIKRVYAEKAVRSGFEDDSLYSDELLMNLDEADIDAFNDLKALIGTTDAEKKPVKVPVNENGLDKGTYDTAERAKKKPKRERTPEQLAALEAMKEAKRTKKALISVLRGISIRIPMMIYGMDIDVSENVDIQTFIDNVDEKSWQEFMPAKVTKGQFKRFEKYYDTEVFIEAGRIIRERVRALDSYDPVERAEELAVIFATFKNPDKETVLTPWRVVNMHMNQTIGGLSFFDDAFEMTTQDAKSVVHWVDNEQSNNVWRSNTNVLEINSKTGLYPLYAAVSMYEKASQSLNEESAGKFTTADLDGLWKTVLKNNIYVIAKTPMAATITQRTLAGYHGYDTNIEYIADFVTASQNNKVEDGLSKVKKAFGNMKFDVIIGNPPYQEQIGNYKYQLHYDFLQLAYQLSSRYVSFIQPLNWLNDPKTLEMVKENLIELHRFSDSTKVFEGVSIPSGVGYELIDKEKSVTETRVFEQGIEKDIEVRGNYTMDDIELMEELNFNNDLHYPNSLAHRVSDYKGHSNKDKSLAVDSDGDIEIWFKKESGKNGKNGWMKVKRSDIPEGEIIDQYKVMISKDGHAERTETKPENIFNNRAEVLKPGQISTDRPYLLVADDERQAKLLADYANSKFFRRILHIQDKANSVPKSSFEDVPDISEWMDAYETVGGNLDVFLNGHYRLSEKMVADINRRIAEK